jgi:MFS transporter, DHA1 family, tetracycline resistance protein
MVIYGLAPTGAWFWVGVPVMSLWGLVGPSILDLMSRRVSESQQGQLQGANSSSRSITGMIGPALFSATFAWLLGWLPGAPFLLAALLLVMAACVTWFVTKPSEAQAP